MVNFIESKIYRAMSTLWDVMYLGFLWTIFSLPLVTIGASTTALYYVATKKVTNRDSTYLFQDFLASFKANFKQATLTTLILTVAGVVVWYNFILLNHNNHNLGMFGTITRFALIFVTCQLLFITLIVFAVIARFDLSLFATIKAAATLANKHLFSTVTNLIVFLAVAYIAFLAPVILLFMMGVYGYFSSTLIVRMFRKNNAEFDDHVEQVNLNPDDE